MRSRSQALINDELLIEFNADTVWHFQKYGFDWEKICGCMITHSHCDHFYPDDIEMASRGYTHEHRTLNLYAAQSAFDQIKPIAEKADSGVTVTLIRAGERFRVGEKYSVLPLWANHDPTATPVLYSIAYGSKKILYAHDTGVFPEQTLSLMKEEEHYDMLSLDCTGCWGNGWEWRDGHMSLKTNLEMIAILRREGLINEKTVIVLNHFSHNGGQTYDEMLKEAEKYGLIVSYDSLEIEL